MFGRRDKLARVVAERKEGKEEWEKGRISS
jgi:hypothetical protein